MAASPNLTPELVNAITPAAGSLIGFIVGAGFSELAEWRRRRLVRGAVCGALQAELQQMEMVLSSLLFRFARGSVPSDDVVKEVRWFLQQSPKRGWPLKLEEREAAERMRAYDDETLRGIIQRLPAQAGNVAYDLPLPTLSSVLTSPSVGLPPEQVRALSIVQWNAHLLSLIAQQINETARVILTVEDQKNQAILTEDRNRTALEYRQRAESTLRMVRRALYALHRTPWYRVSRRRTKGFEETTASPLSPGLA